MTFSLRSIFVVLFICIQSIGYAQNDDLSDSIDSINEIPKAEERIKKFKVLISDTDISKTKKEKAVLFHELARSYNKAKDYENALLYLTKAIQIKQQLKDKTSLNKSLYLKASVYQKLKQVSDAYTILLQIVHANENDKYTCNSYRKLANIERDIGDFYKALQYLNDGLLNKKLSKNADFKSLLSGGVIAIYSKIYETSFEVKEDTSDLAAVKFYQKNIEDNLDFFQSSEDKLAGIYTNLANVYDSFQELEEALKFYKKAQKIYKEIEDLYEERDVTLNIGIVYSRQKKHQLANQLYQRVIDNSDDIYQIANAYNCKGYFLNTKFADEKIPYLEKAVAICSEQKEPLNNDFQLPTLSQIKEAESEQEALTYLIDLADHYVEAFEQKKEKKYLLKAKKTVVLIDELVSLIRYETDTEASKLFWIGRGVNVYMLAVETCYLLNDIENAFYFMEKNKALLLQENIKTLQAKLALDIPKDLLEREYNLNYEVLNLQKQFLQEIDNELTQQKFATKKREFQTFMDSMQRAYPQYIKTKEKIAIVSLESVIKKYKAKETAFVEYILHETDGYGIYYDGQTLNFFKIENATEFQKQLASLRNFMTKPLDTKERKEFRVIGHQVFQKLFPFENALKRLQNKKITIISDHTLQYIPFELLPMQTTGKLSESYLINTTEISYLQSFSLFEQIQKKQNTPTKKLLAIAPIEFQNKELPTLAGATEVFQFFKQDTTSLILQKEQATKANFLKHRNNFEIIHLNTHAGLDSLTQTPWIAFQDSNMTLNELFGLENQAELVVLDACKTNDGVNISGEGIINLSRGFFYNGTQSVLASQWNVNEKAGNEILQTFYTELENGNSKSKALQLAKKKYLQLHETEQNVPYFWAAFTLTGSTNPVTSQSWLNTTTITIGIIMLILVFFYYRKKIFR
ncbi:CHAT domain-containing protein [Kordia sp.]|uniref:CHAT domain-containing protein n=1 Tax=Kordia sp. TaxID=1965332 RepID=UPI003D6ADB2B